MGVKKQFERGDESLSSTSLMASTQSIKASRERKQRCRRMLEARFKVCTEHSSNCAKGAIRKDCRLSSSSSDAEERGPNRPGWLNVRTSQ